MRVALPRIRVAVPSSASSASFQQEGSFRDDGHRFMREHQRCADLGNAMGIPTSFFLLQVMYRIVVDQARSFISQVAGTTTQASNSLIQISAVKIISANVTRVLVFKTIADTKALLN